MAIEVETSVEIHRSPEDVYAVISDIPNTPDWIGAVLGVEDFSGEPTGVGTTFKQVSKFLGKTFTIDVEVTVFNPPERLGQRVGGMVSGDMMLTVEPAGDGSQLTLRFAGETGGLFGLAGPLLKSSMLKQMNSDLANLKQMMES